MHARMSANDPLRTLAAQMACQTPWFAAIRPLTALKNLGLGNFRGQSWGLEAQKSPLKSGFGGDHERFRQSEKQPGKSRRTNVRASRFERLGSPAAQPYCPRAHDNILRSSSRYL